MSEATWNHRIIQFVDTDGSPWFAIHEVHYVDGKPEMYTEDPVPVASETVEGMRWQLEMMLKCLSFPVLKESDFSVGSDTAKRAESCSAASSYGENHSQEKP
jgi:hypothetical protein